MGQSLTKLIEAALLDGNAGVMTKIAQEAEGDEHEEAEHKCEGCGKAAVAGSKFCKECAENKARSEERASGMKEGEGSEKTSSARIEKLAAAVEYIRDNFFEIQMPIGRVKMADAGASADSGPGVGANSLETNLKRVTSADEAPEGFGEAKTKKPSMTIPLEAGASPNAAATAVQTNAGTPPGGAGEQPQMIQPSGTGGDKPQAKTASVHRIMQAMMKAAADGEEKAQGQDSNIKAPKTMDTTTPEDKPSGVERPAEVTSQEKHLATSEAAIDVTKRDAKEVPKKRMGDVLTEPALSASTDSTLNKALGTQVVTEAGAKIAAAQARVLLQKTASQKCTCGGKSECGFCKIASRIGQKHTERADALWAAGHKPGTPARSV